MFSNRRQATEGRDLAGPRWSPALRLMIALGIMACALLLRYAFWQQLGNAGFIFPLLGTLLVAGLCGVWPCVLVQTLMLVVEAQYFPRAPGDPDEPRNYAGIIAFYGVGIVMGIISEFAQAAQRRAQARRAEVLAHREQLRATLTCMADGVLVTDRQGRLTMLNPQAEQLTGWTAAEALGRPVTEVFPLRNDVGADRLPDPVRNLLRHGAPMKDVRSTLVMKHRGELPVTYSATALMDPEEKRVGVVLVFRDDTERCHSEQRLHDDARRKDEFLATLAHELRNPLAPIRTGLELIKMSPDNPQIVGDVRGMMERQTQHMSRLIDDLLDVSRITRGKLQLRMGLVDLNEVLQTATDAVQPRIQKAGHCLQVETPDQPLLLHADTHRLTQAFSNLLDNAAKYTPPGGQIEVVAHRAGREAVVSISDSGIGIPKAMRERIFDLFTQVDRSIESAHSGLGIGLTLVKRLVEMHHGRIDVTSNHPEPGSTFTVRLPMLAEAMLPASTAPPTADEHLSQRRHRILVVDDNVDALETLSMMVRLLGHEVATAHDGEEALVALERFQPQIVLMDIGMPKLNGYDAARRMRQLPCGAGLLLIATTGWGQEEDRHRTADAGFDHHLVKPVEPAVLRKLLEDYAPAAVVGSSATAAATT